MPSIAELRRRYADVDAPLAPEDRAALARDPRAGVRALLASLDRRSARHEEARARHEVLRATDAAHWDQGRTLAGVDEAGMSPWAGPIVAAAVILGPESALLGVDDSKTLSEQAREALAERIKCEARAWAVGASSPNEVARLNVHHAGLLAMRRAVAALRPRPDALLVDARTVPGFAGVQDVRIKADGQSLSAAAASIVAKTTRDRFMRRLAAAHPGYGFERHKGYGVDAHRQALARMGPTPHHRLAFEAVRAILAGEGR